MLHTLTRSTFFVSPFTLPFVYHYWLFFVFVFFLLLCCIEEEMFFCFLFFLFLIINGLYISVKWDQSCMAKIQQGRTQNFTQTGVYVHSLIKKQQHCSLIYSTHSHMHACMGTHTHTHTHAHTQAHTHTLMSDTPFPTRTALLSTAV